MEVPVVVGTATTRTVTTVQITDRKGLVALEDLQRVMLRYEEKDIHLKIIIQEQIKITRIGDPLVHL